MKYSGFSIRNFRGIKKLDLNFGSQPQSNVSVFVGLNECGKTTVMEALSFFHENINKKENFRIIGDTVSKNDIHSLIPKNRKDNFSDCIEIEAQITLDDKDKKEIKKILEDKNFKCTEFSSESSISCKYHFKNSSFDKKSYSWSIEILGRQGKGKKDIVFNSKHDAWNEAYEHLCKSLPEIIYYPNFLFDFPDFIYLEDRENEGIEQRFYRKLIQDILDSLNNKLNLNTHLVKRAKSDENSDKEALESVINKMSHKVSNVVFNKTTSVFSSNQNSKSILISFPKKDSAGDLYVEMKLKDYEDSYYIRERSLGFRWFFTFSLFTQFRVHRLNEGGSIVFLFDEPASNLHQTAQQKLTNAFEQLAKTQVSIIYATHSHHLIKPQWLENTFIVRNKALNYQQDEINESYNSAMTDITIEKYRSFVSNHPEKITYYQPILDVLEYKPSNIENIPDVVILEGKNDFYALSYFQEIIKKSDSMVNFLPGTGSGNLGTVISLYIAWGKRFVILLDSDKAGTDEKQRYIDEFEIIIQNKIFTYRDIDDSWLGVKMENLIDMPDKLRIVQKVNPNAKETKKKKLFLALQENLINKEYITFASDTNTKSNFLKILDFLDDKMS